MLIVFEYTQKLGTRKLLGFKMRFEGDQSLSYSGPFEKAQVLELPACRFVLPNFDQKPN